MTIRVLTSPSGEGGDANPTVAMLVESLPAGVDSVPFTWARAWSRSWDILHVHWPEALVRAGRGRVTLKRVAFVVLLAYNRIRRRPMVWTVHNVEPHEPGSLWESMILRLWDRWASARIFLYDSALPPGQRAGDTVIRRGDYEPRFGHHVRGSAGAGVLTFGLVRPYKKIESLIAAVRQIDSSVRPALTVVGAPLDGAYAAELERSARYDEGVTFDLQAVPDARLATYIEACELVVLPYRNTYNSGAALLALTLARPVLVTASQTMAELAAEVGGSWVQQIEGELTAERLLEALATARTIAPDAKPDLGERDWSSVGQRHAELYRALLSGRQLDE